MNLLQTVTTKPTLNTIETKNLIPIVLNFSVKFFKHFYGKCSEGLLFLCLSILRILFIALGYLLSYLRIPLNSK